jgi:hypothetical protein
VLSVSILPAKGVVESQFAYARTLHPLHCLTPVTLPHRSQTFDPNCNVGIPSFPNASAHSNAVRSQPPPDLQMGTTVSKMNGTYSAVAPRPGLRRAIAVWRSSPAGLSQTWHNQGREARISALCRSTTDVMNWPVASGSGSGPGEGGPLHSDRGACSEYSKGYARPSGVGLPHMTR